MESWASRYLSSSGVQKIEEAIKQAELKTSGEIVPMVVRSSSTVGHVPIVLFTIFILMFYVLGLYDYVHDHFSQTWVWTMAWVLLSFVLVRVLSGWPKVQRLFVNSVDRESQVRARALNEFYQAGLNKTEGSTGILLMVSLNDHEAVVLADKNISEKLSPETWSEVVGLLLDGAKRKDLNSGFCQAIKKCGEILEPHFPIQPDDQNELPNKLIIKD